MIKKRIGGKNQKITLSVDRDVYQDFQKYCEEHAIMLSKRIELFMREILKSKKGLLFVILFLGVLFMSFGSADVIMFENFESANLTNWTIANGLTSGWYLN